MDVCRACMTSDKNLVSIFDEQEIAGRILKLADILSIFSTIQVTMNDGMPHKLCSRCVYQLHQIAWFKQVCERSDKALREHLGIPPAFSGFMNFHYEDRINGMGYQDPSVVAIKEVLVVNERRPEVAQRMDSINGSYFMSKHTAQDSMSQKQEQMPQESPVKQEIRSTSNASAKPKRTKGIIGLNGKLKKKYKRKLKPKRITKTSRKQREENKKLRNSGKAYISEKGKLVQARTMKPLTECRMRCKDRFQDEKRQVVFNEYWNLGEHDKRASYLGSLLTILDKKTQRAKDIEKCRMHTYKYEVIIDGNRHPICKQCFANTFGETKAFIEQTALKKKHVSSGIVYPDMRGRQPGNNRRKKKPEEVSETNDAQAQIVQAMANYSGVDEFLLQFPTFSTNLEINVPNLQSNVSNLEINAT